MSAITGCHHLVQTTETNLLLREIEGTRRGSETARWVDRLIRGVD